MAAAIYSTTAQEGIDINTVFTLDPKGTPEYPAPPFVAGELAWGTDGSEWVYCTASTTITAASVVLISAVPGAWSVAMIGGTVATAPTGQLLGVVGGATGTLSVPAPTGTQTGQFFWVQRAGNAPNVRVSASINQFVSLHSAPANPGMVVGTSGGTGTSYQIVGMVFANATASTAGPNAAVLNYPTVGVTA